MGLFSSKWGKHFIFYAHGRTLRNICKTMFVVLPGMDVGLGKEGALSHPVLPHYSKDPLEVRDFHALKKSLPFKNVFCINSVRGCMGLLLNRFEYA